MLVRMAAGFCTYGEGRWSFLRETAEVSPQLLLCAGASYAGAIAGGVIGGIVLLGILGYLLGVGLWSWRSYGFRARKRLIEDQVFSIVIGAQSSDIYGPSSTANHADGQVSLSQQDQGRQTIMSHCKRRPASCCGRAHSHHLQAAVGPIESRIHSQQPLKSFAHPPYQCIVVLTCSIYHEACLAETTLHEAGSKLVF